MDELDSGAMALLIDREITAAEQAARQRAARYEAAGLLADAARVWDEFALAVKPLRDQKHALVMAMARIKGLETPSPIIVNSTPS